MTAETETMLIIIALLIIYGWIQGGKEGEGGKEK